MAIEKITIVRSDLSGESEASTVAFGLRGTWYEIDLTASEEEGLQKALEQYLSVGRKASPGTGEPKAALVPKMTQAERNEIRAWARENGFEVPVKGKLSKSVLAAWYEAHPEKRPADKSLYTQVRN